MFVQALLDYQFWLDCPSVLWYRAAHCFICQVKWEVSEVNIGSREYSCMQLHLNKDIAYQLRGVMPLGINKKFATSHIFYKYVGYE